MTSEQLLRAKIDQVIASSKHILIVFLRAIPVSAIIALIVWFVLSRLENRYSIITRKKKAAVGLSFYFMLILQMGVFFRPFGSVREIKWIPFNTPGGDNLIFLLATANAVIFIPLGILVPMVFGRINSWWKMMIVALVVSFGIETIQYVLECGHSELEDVIMNTIGGIIGYFIIKTIRKRNDRNKQQMEN